MGKTNPLIALRAHDELRGRGGREGSIEREKNDCGYKMTKEKNDARIRDRRAGIWSYGVERGEVRVETPGI